MISIFENILRNLSGDDITSSFSITMLIVFSIGIILKLKNRQDKGSEFTNYLPTLLTSLGILGTFIGIVSGLLNFDIENIDGSISQLLSGMKTAFSTSVIGVFLSILLKTIYAIFSKKKKEENSKESMDIEDIIDNFYTQTKYLKLQSEQSDELNKQIVTMIKTLGSDSDSSLLGQIKLGAVLDN